MTVLDATTNKSLFGDDMMSGISAALGIDDKIDFSKTPTTDLQLINARLDAIGELVGDEELRKRFSGLANLLELPFAEFYGALGLVKVPAGMYGFRRNLADTIKDMGDYSSDLPEFGDIQSEILNGIIEGYKAIAFGETGIKAALDYFSGLKQQVLDKEEQIIKEDKEAGYLHELTGRPPKLSRDTLEEMMDLKKVKSFIPAVEQISPLSIIVGVYSRLANDAVTNNYVRPEVVPREENCLIIEDGWYDTGRVKQVVSNSTQFAPERRVELLEGVNSGGKTFDMMKAFQIASMALAGTWVPAKYAKVSIRDKIIMREKGTGETMSAFEQDCRSVRECTPNKGEYWLIGMDETFTSTEKRGGAALTYGLINMVLEQGNSAMILSSHYPELHQAFDEQSGVVFNHFPFEKRQVGGKEDVVFPHVKQQGPMKDYSYAIAVARTQGFDSRILDLAEQRLMQG
ncbi:MAG: hypothetical protein AABX51_08665 [Nanoarchaeota archaeon]